MPRKLVQDGYRGWYGWEGRFNSVMRMSVDALWSIKAKNEHEKHMMTTKMKFINKGEIYSKQRLKVESKVVKKDYVRMKASTVVLREYSFYKIQEKDAATEKASSAPSKKKDNVDGLRRSHTFHQSTTKTFDRLTIRHNTDPMSADRGSMGAMRGTGLNQRNADKSNTKDVNHACKSTENSSSLMETAICKSDSLIVESGRDSSSELNDENKMHGLTRENSVVSDRVKLIKKTQASKKATASIQENANLSKMLHTEKAPSSKFDKHRRPAFPPIEETQEILMELQSNLLSLANDSNFKESESDLLLNTKETCVVNSSSSIKSATSTSSKRVRFPDSETSNRYTALDEEVSDINISQGADEEAPAKLDCECDRNSVIDQERQKEVPLTPEEIPSLPATPASPAKPNNPSPSRADSRTRIPTMSPPRTGSKASSGRPSLTRAAFSVDRSNIPYSPKRASIFFEDTAEDEKLRDYILPRHPSTLVIRNVKAKPLSLQKRLALRSRNLVPKDHQQSKIFPEDCKTAFSFKRFIEKRTEKVVESWDRDQVRMRKMTRIAHKVKLPDLVQRSKTTSAIFRDYKKYKDENYPPPKEPEHQKLLSPLSRVRERIELRETGKQGFTRSSIRD